MKVSNNVKKVIVTWLLKKINKKITKLDKQNNNKGANQRNVKVFCNINELSKWKIENIKLKKIKLNKTWDKIIIKPHK
ncbi:hypothetical protein STURON_00138 [Spiroplasma turonicum]|uniref:Uncharacterized protein n=1 Tax=Spiroplasma turonicum TaxID=216946 RepID=A0A0K1P5C5_9MOLU|nr:hypothetical protein STURON_00138 [Spiroplasma turonicum]